MNPSSSASERVASDVCPRAKEAICLSIGPSFALPFVGESHLLMGGLVQFRQPARAAQGVAPVLESAHRTFPGEFWQERMQSERRRGKTDSKTRKMILDVAEDIMLESGYAAVTARKIAARAEVSFQLVHYYFRSMDDLFVEILRRSTDLYRRELAKIAKSDRPLTGLWKMNSKSRRSTLSVQFMALATHNEAVRVALKDFGDQFRKAQIELIERHLAGRHEVFANVSAEVLAVAIENVARMMVFGDTLHLSIGHRGTKKYFQRSLQLMEEVGQAALRDA